MVCSRACCVRGVLHTESAEEAQEASHAALDGRGGENPSGIRTASEGERGASGFNALGPEHVTRRFVRELFHSG